MANEHDQQNPPPPPREPMHPPVKPGPLSRNQIQHLHVAGTVPIPRFPELGRIWYFKEGVADDKNNYKPPLIRVEHDLGHSAGVTRTCLIQDVSAIFIPRDPNDVDLSKGRFFVGPEIENELDKARVAGKAVLGIVYVHETARTHTEVSMGMTAAQSVAYAPPFSAWC